MMRTKIGVMLWVAAAALGLGTGCGDERDDVGVVNTEPAPIDLPQDQPLGAPCLYGEEWEPTFTNFALEEIWISDDDSQCASRLCLVNQFQGRLSCPYGQAAPEDPNQFDAPPCLLPDGRARASKAVEPQLENRRPEDAVYCSCRCAGPGPGPFCACPSGFECALLIDFSFGPESEHLEGSYCIKEGTAYDGIVGPSCDWSTQSCGPG